MKARFPVGAKVRVRSAFPPGHVRTPFFIRGKVGEVAAIAGDFANPEELAYGRDGLPELTLYRVIFRQQDVWPDYKGGPEDTAVLDIFEHWLDAAQEGAAQNA